MNVLWLREGEVLQAFFDLRLAPVLGNAWQKSCAAGCSSMTI
jgi:hypothetical protein